MPKERRVDENLEGYFVLQTKGKEKVHKGKRGGKGGEGSWT